ncbi:hypothetical protein GCM10009648_35070 [Tsukamurella spumae]|uniref:Antitoxin n=2 Tax=Tsukamurella spumae TaxID=44753 RepID=A0A846X0D5_9ACTN|nr:hypothetical protein [Tsukamurella spumae]
MPNVLIRGLSAAAVERIDEDAAALGLSRNEYLRRRFEDGLPMQSDVAVSAEDWARSADAFVDLADPDVMDAAWR